MFRDIQKLSGTALIADLFILVGLIYIFTIEFRTLAANGIADVRFFNPDRFPLLIGTAVFAFEGIGLIIPITESMKEPQKFPKVLSGVMVFVMALFAGSGVLAYSTYGSDIQTVVLVNLPASKFVTAVQFLYAVAISLSTPLQLFPAVRIMENGLFSRSGKYDAKIKWEKNAFRLSAVVLCSLIAWAGARDLDKFVGTQGPVARFAVLTACTGLARRVSGLVRARVSYRLLPLTSPAASPLDSGASAGHCVRRPYLASRAQLPYVCPLSLAASTERFAAPMLHYKIAQSRKQKIADVCLFIFGVCMAIYTTSQTVRPASGAR
jgi:amino acid permease